MKKVLKFLKNVYLKITKYIYTNRLFLSYLLLATLGSMTLRYFTIGHFFSFKPLMSDIGFILLLGSFGYLIKPKDQFKYFFGLLIFFSLIEIINSVYYIFYASFASLAELATLG